MAYLSFKPTDYFNPKIYTGTGSSNAITGVGFQPDWTWIKSRSNTYSHVLIGAVRGVGTTIATNSTNDAYSSPTEITSFDSDGFTLGTDSGVNNSSSTFVSWNWKANGQGSSNGEGSITTTYTSANTTSGCSIITFSGNSTSGATIGHGLGVAPEVVIVKALNTNGYDWGVYHSALGNTKNMRLNLQDPEATSTAFWNDTTPTSSLVYLGDNATVDGAYNYVAYCFAPVTGFSSFGKYNGTGNTDGAFIYTGFRPGWIMIKRYDSGTEDWNMWDSKRIGYNVSGNDKLFANLNNVEDTSENAINILSNGFQLRSTNGGFNSSSGSYIYMAFAEFPIVGSNDNVGLAR